MWAAVVCVLLAACGKPPASAPPPPKVTVVQPVEREVTEWDEYTARFEAVDSVEVRPRVSGYLQSIHFQDGTKQRIVTKLKNERLDAEAPGTDRA